jgi:hypothetical protein
MAWYDELPEDLTVDNGDGTKTIARDHPFIRESPEMGHFVNKALAQHKEFGARIPVKKAETPEAVAEWRKNHLPRLYDAGVLERPPARPEDYEIKRPDVLVNGFNWSDERAKGFASLLHKYGIPKSAAGEFLALHEQALAGQQKELNTSKEAATAALKAEYGDKYEDAAAQAGRFKKHIFKTPEEETFFSETGIGDHPLFLSVMMRLAAQAANDTSIFPDGNRAGGTPTMTGEAVTAEVAKIMTDPNHPKHKLYHAGDPATMAEIDALYKQAYPGTYVIS